MGVTGDAQRASRRSRHAVHTALDHPLAQLAQQPALTGQSAEEDAVAQESESTSARVKM